MHPRAIPAHRLTRATALVFLTAALVLLTLGACGTNEPPLKVWEPGHYLIVNTAEMGNGGQSAAKVSGLLKQSDAEHFTGVQVKLLWRDLEPAMGQYDFTSLDQVLQAAADAPQGCTAGDGDHRPCRVVLQVQYKTPSPEVPAVPDYLLSTGAACNMNGVSCRIPAVPADRTELQKTFCATTGDQRCGAHEFGSLAAGTGESLAMMWLPGVEQRFQKFMSALETHVLDSPRASTLAAYALPETTFEADPANDGHILVVDEGYTRQAYTDAIQRTMMKVHHADPSRVAFQFVGNLPDISRKDLPTWRAMVESFYDFAARTEGLGIGHPDIAPLLRPTRGDPPRSVNPALTTMTDTARYSVPRNPSVQAPDVKADRTTGLSSSYDLVVNQARGNYIAWTTSNRDAVFTWHDVAGYLADHPMPAANLAPPPGFD